MRYIMPIVEQLDRAARELATDHPINNRLALILIDNAVELILHRRCRDHLMHEKTAVRIGRARLTPKQRQMARGSFLDGKLIALRVLGDITEPERRFIAICHDYRSELYHVGLGHQDVVRAMAGRYFELCCDLFARLKPSYVSWGSNEQMSSLGQKYLEQLLGKDRSSFAFVEVDKVAPLVLAKLPQTPPLPSTLADAAQNAIDRVRDAFQFIVDENPGRMNAQEVLQHIQFYYDLSRRAEREGIEGSALDQEHRRRWSELYREMRKSWKATFRRLPHENWRRRAKTIAGQADALAALDRYQALRNDMAYLEDVITEAATDLDAEIQFQIDMRRGK